jgi:hypothetical protein
MRLLLILTPLLLGVSCSTASYDRGRSFTQEATDNAVRYGTVGAGGAAGYFAGKELLGGTAGGAAGAGIGAAAAYGANLFGDDKAQRSYLRGYEDGADNARQEIVNEMWRREAEYGIPRDGVGTGGEPTKRNVYVPSRTLNGVEYPATSQSVDLYR